MAEAEGSGRYLISFLLSSSVGGAFMPPPTSPRPCAFQPVYRSIGIVLYHDPADISGVLPPASTNNALGLYKGRSGHDSPYLLLCAANVMGSGVGLHRSPTADCRWTADDQ